MTEPKSAKESQTAAEAAATAADGGENGAPSPAPPRTMSAKAATAKPSAPKPAAPKPAAPKAAPKPSSPDAVPATEDGNGSPAGAADSIAAAGRPPWMRVGWDGKGPRPAPGGTATTAGSAPSVAAPPAPGMPAPGMPAPGTPAPGTAIGAGEAVTQAITMPAAPLAAPAPMPVANEAATRPTQTARPVPEQRSEHAAGPPTGGLPMLGSALGGANWSTARPSRGRHPRQAHLQLKRLDPWSVLKLSLVLAVVVFFVWMVAVGVLYGVLDGMGVWDQLNVAYSELAPGAQAEGGTVISVWRVLSFAAVVGAINSLLLAVAATVGAFVYNVSADLVGGIELTLSERD